VNNNIKKQQISTKNSLKIRDLSLSELLLKFYQHIDRRRKQQLLLLVGLTLISSIAEIISLGAIMPFIAVLTQPDSISEYSFVLEAFKFLRIFNEDNIALSLTIIFMTASLLAGGLRLFLLWFSIRLTNATGSDISIDAYNRTLYQPYKVHIASSSSSIISSITQKVSVATSILMSLVSLITSFILFLSISITLIFINPIMAIVAGLSFGTLYWIIAWNTVHRLRNNGKCIALEQTNVVKALQEGLGAIRDILIDGVQGLYSSIYGKSIRRLMRANAENKFINQAPRYAMETFGLLLIASLAYVLTTKDNGANNVFPQLAALALGAQRLLPLMQLLYGNWATISSSHAALSDVVDLLEQPLPNNINQKKLSPLQFQNSIGLNHISFRYTDKGPLVLDDITLTIYKGSRVGFIGSTGDGKTTILDIIMLLLRPTQGTITVDGSTMDERLKGAWQQNVSHVPQNIFLIDSTITENIAFGIPLKDIDFLRVQDAASRAQIAEFIENSAEGYNTIVGERGVKLSGGQRQRIGIARALYKQANLIILDEATSALDSKTERKFMEEIEKLGDDVTIIIVAHRLTTLENCSIIVELSSGKINNIGSYEEIVMGGL
jgi:ATP-binding cassette, subfamily B, bacterial PglK